MFVAFSGCSQLIHGPPKQPLSCVSKSILIDTIPLDVLRFVVRRCVSNGTRRRTRSIKPDTRASVSKSRPQCSGDPNFILVTDRIDAETGEQRFNAIGLVEATFLIVAHVYRETINGEEIIRIISAGKANERERRIYFE
jgi:uncharacterized DUF497 family protein